MDAPRDANHVPVGLGVSSTSSTVTVPYKIDSVTGRLLIDVTLVSDDGSDISEEDAERDGNFRPVMLATKHDNTGIASPAIDSRNGNLYLDLELT
jgi:hypothetical protein